MTNKMVPDGRRRRNHFRAKCRIMNSIAEMTWWTGGFERSVGGFESRREKPERETTNEKREMRNDESHLQLRSGQDPMTEKVKDGATGEAIEIKDRSECIL